MKLIEIIGWMLYVPIMIAFALPTIWLLIVCWPLAVVIAMFIIGFTGARILDRTREEKENEV